jgi:hypothetical protein
MVKSMILPFLAVQHLTLVQSTTGNDIVVASMSWNRIILVCRSHEIATYLQYHLACSLRPYKCLYTKTLCDVPYSNSLTLYLLSTLSSSRTDALHLHKKELRTRMKEGDRTSISHKINSTVLYY